MFLVRSIALVLRVTRNIAFFIVYFCLRILLFLLDLNIMSVEWCTQYRHPTSDKIGLVLAVLELGAFFTSLCFQGGLMMMWLDWSNRIIDFITQDVTIKPYTIQVHVAFNLPTLVKAPGIVLYNLLILAFLLVSCGSVLLVSHPAVFILVGFLMIYSRW